MPATRVVIDTNVWLSAALSTVGSPALVVQRVLTYAVPLFSDATFAELEARIWKPKFDRYLSMETRRNVLRDARALSHWVDIPANLAATHWSRDAEDDKFIQTALAGAARWLVTGDQDLLVLDGELDVRILSPAQALLLPEFLAGSRGQSP